MKEGKKNFAVLCGNLALLGFFYWLCRYALFDLHGMKDWPNILAVCVLAALANSWAFRKRWFSLSAVLGYPCGFGIGLALNWDAVNSAGVRSNNLWLIWAGCLLGFLLMGAALELCMARAAGKKRSAEVSKR